MIFDKAFEAVTCKTADRYHIRFNTGDEWVMSEHADRANGICYYNGTFFWSIPAGSFELDYAELPDGVKKTIHFLERVN